jgi:hypothetical protein
MTPERHRDRSIPVSASDVPDTGTRAARGRGGGQSITVSVPALRTFMALGAVVVLSVVLSVIATITLIAVMNAGVILPQYSRLNQPTQVSQLGVCVSKTGKISTPTNVNTCLGGKFVHVQPRLTHP